MKALLSLQRLIYYYYLFLIYYYGQLQVQCHSAHLFPPAFSKCHVDLSSKHFEPSLALHFTWSR